MHQSGFCKSTIAVVLCLLVCIMSVLMDILRMSRCQQRPSRQSGHSVMSSAQESTDNINFWLK